MPLWGLIAIVAGGVLLAAASILGGFALWRAIEKRQVVRLVGRIEAVESGSAALTDIVTHLANGSDADLLLFAEDATSTDRHALQEVSSQASILSAELDEMPLSKRLVPVAEALADAAYVIAREAGRVGGDVVGDGALEALASVDLGSVVEMVSAARERVEAVCDACGLDDAAVYGGGLYL